ncbi:hypothetical protein [Algibacter sp. L4_22]|uniref:hypothetical protein n=1 Tax=Algibacter sp. L4_22 TaxID=2942477 RepID=UPI00201B50CA|nr:hypothetical protein [Algibacter sp. L4_22]MCL5130605.1 hypothetical protein [Algibacter sp. L4_22]
MKENLIELYSMKAKLSLNFYIFMVLFGLYGSYKSIMDWENIVLKQEYLFPIMMIVLIIVGITLYLISFIGYFDSKNHKIILKKTFLKYKKIIKLEDILKIETTRLLAVTRAKHLKITIIKSNKDVESFYIMKSNSMFGDDEKMLREAILKRKIELKNKIVK